MYIVGFNGPPHSGKDTIANGLTEILRQKGYRIPTYRVALSQPMRKTVFQLLGQEYNDSLYEATKDIKQPMFGLQTIRQVMIALSEEFVKPRYGQDFWAKRLLGGLAVNLVTDDCLVIVSDIGFQAECDYFDSYTDRKFLTVQLERDGTDWSKDSRDYCSGEFVQRILNNARIDTATNYVISQMLRMGWNLQ